MHIGRDADVAGNGQGSIIPKEIDRRAAPRASASRSASVTDAPSASSRRAIANPMPRAAPVTSALRPPNLSLQVMIRSLSYLTR